MANGRTLVRPEWTTLPGGDISAAEWGVALTDIGDIKAGVNLVETRTFDVRKYGSIFTANDAPAFQAAIDAVHAAGGGVVTGPAGFYTFTAGLTVPDGVSFEFPGSGSTEFDFSAMTTNAPGPAGIYAGGTLTNLGGLGADVQKDTLAITLAAAPTGVMPGDYLIIYNSTDGSFNPARSYYRAGEFLRVLSVSGTTITLTAPTYASYTVHTNRTVYKVTPARVALSGFRAVFKPGASGIVVDLGTGVKIDDVRATGSNHSIIQLRRCVDVTLNDVHAWDASPSVAINYGVSIVNCQSVTIDESFLETTRHGLTLTGIDVPGCVPNRNITVRGGRISSNGNLTHGMGLDMHGNVEHVQFIDVDMPRGVMIAGDHTYLRGRVRSGPGGTAIRSREMIGWSHEIDVKVTVTEQTVAGFGWIDLKETGVTRQNGHLQVKAEIDAGAYGNISGTHYGVYIYNNGGSHVNDVTIDLTVHSGLPDLGSGALALWLRAAAGTGWRDVDYTVKAKRMGVRIECSPRLITRHDCDIYEPPREGIITVPVASPIWTSTRMRSYNNRVLSAGSTGISDQMSGVSGGELISDNDQSVSCNRLGIGTTYTGTSWYIANIRRVVRRNCVIGDDQGTPTQLRSDGVDNVGTFIDVRPVIVGSVTTKQRGTITTSLEDPPILAG